MEVARGPWPAAAPPHTATPADVFGEAVDLGYWQDRDVPRREWMVENCFLRGTVALVSGDGGIGKSLLMQQLCACATLGRSWLGLSVRGGRALMLACEDDRDELVRRQSSINRMLGCEFLDLQEAGMELRPRVGMNNTLMALERKEWKMRGTPLFERLVKHCREHGIQYIVIDTATQTFGGNQNDEVQVTAFISELRRLAIAVQGVVILTKHPSMAGRSLGTGESGNVSWNNSSRSRWYMHKKNGQLVFAARKSNYGPSDLEIPIRWQAGSYVKVENEAATPWYADN